MVEHKTVGAPSTDIHVARDKKDSGNHAVLLKM